MKNTNGTSYMGYVRGTVRDDSIQATDLSHELHFVYLKHFIAKYRSHLTRLATKLAVCVVFKGVPIVLQGTAFSAGTVATTVANPATTTTTTYQPRMDADGRREQSTVARQLHAENQERAACEQAKVDAARCAIRVAERPHRRDAKIEQRPNVAVHARQACVEHHGSQDRHVHPWQDPLPQQQQLSGVAPAAQQ